MGVYRTIYIVQTLYLYRYGRDSDYDSLDNIFRNLLNNDDNSVLKSDDVDSDMERSVGSIRAKAKGKIIISLKKGRGFYIEINIKNNL